MSPHLKSTLAALSLLCLSILSLRAEEILFIGNSFTFGDGDEAVLKLGGVPKLLEGIAASKGKKADTMMITSPGKNFAYHLAQPATDAGLKAKAWDWIVLQDYSTEPTHIGDVAEFMKDGETFYSRIAQSSPKAKIALYQTWAYDPKNPVFAATSDAKHFASPDEMTGELVKNYAALQADLQAKDAQRQVDLARVGEAFARCHKEHPELLLNSTKDYKHANRDGSYLAALVIYTTLFGDLSTGATTTFPGVTIDPKDAAILQSVADEVSGKK